MVKIENDLPTWTGKPEKWEIYSFVYIAGEVETALRAAVEWNDSSKAAEAIKQATEWAELFQTKFEKLTS